MTQRKLSQTYFFSVEGNTEKWYLDWLEQLINNEQSAAYKVKIKSKVEPSPISMMKSLPTLDKTELTHFADFESPSKEHVEKFQKVLGELKNTKNKGKDIKYSLGYSNFTFELWVILHKRTCIAPLNRRDQYLSEINKSFGVKHSSLSLYKKEEAFKKLLKGLTLDDVKDAVSRSKSIMETNANNGHSLIEFKGFKYYQENPSLTVWESIEKIFVR